MRLDFLSFTLHLKPLLWRLTDQARRNAEYFERRRLVFVIVAAIAFPLYYYVWHDLFPQPYENLPLRLLGSALFLPIIASDYWPSRYRKFLPAYWYLVLLFVLPFFFFFMLFKNGGSAIWIESTLAAFFVMLLLLDWVSMIVYIVVGVGFAILAYSLTTEGVLFDFAILQHLPILGFAAVFGVISNYAIEVVRLEHERAMAVAAGMAHELRTPLLGIRSGAAGLRRYLPALIGAYKLAQEKNLDVNPIRRVHLEAMSGVLDRIESEVNYSNGIIDLLLANVRLARMDREEQAVCSLVRCVDLALDRYPFTSSEKSRVFWSGAPDIAFRGSELLMVHVIFNLLKNALRHVSQAGKGDIAIRVDKLPQGGRLVFRDTGSGIPPEVLPHIFKRFYSTPSAGESLLGSGIGLAFCHDVMQAIGGSIECSSEFGQYTEFVLTFPELRP